MNIDNSTVMARPGQRLEDHCRNVSDLCGAFAGKFGCTSCGKLIGLCHDVGKAFPQWQKYLFSDEERGTVTHAPESAGEFFHILPDNLATIAPLPAYAVYGHHSSLPDWISGLDAVQNTEHIGFQVPGCYPPPEELYPQLIPDLQCSDPEQIPFLIRMLFSSLVDADRLDAEHFESPETSRERGLYDNWDTLEKRFFMHMKSFVENSPESAVNSIRSEIRTQCESAADKPCGFFSLNVPTGGGKTLSSLAFALKHRAVHQMSRIIYVIPFNSIIEQTARIYKDILGDENVLEHHHSFVLPDDRKFDSLRRKYELAAENWDMPVIVTTMVQLFESLLHGKASGSRKLHNIANSILILDEAQKLPPEHLHAVLTSLRVLVERFGCTILLCSATIPTVDMDWIGRERYQIRGLPEVCPVISNPEELEKRLKRTRVTMLGVQSLADIAEKIEQEKQVLCIVNTRKRCLDLYNMIHAPCKYHLSASMCPADRQQVLSEIRKDLKAGKDIVIIATSLIEAGVDIDVRTVYREIAGVDSIAQAAGRCNREGKHKCGEVYVFTPAEGQPVGIQRFASEAAQDAIGDKINPEMDQALYRKYFEHFYAKCSSLLDKDNYAAAFPLNSLQYQFRDFGEKFHMIDDEGQIPVVVLYGNAANVIEHLRVNGPSKAVFRQLRSYTVNIREADFAKLQTAGMTEEIFGVAVQVSSGIYVPGTGIQLDTLSTYQF